MTGPTPVSALIHAATMVAAGVYLVGRCYPLFTPESRLVIAYTGGITLFLAATVAMTMTDLKRVLAWSTVSQLGYMMLALGVGGWAVALFHLLTHSFFKSLLFLGAGNVIHGYHGEQDLDRMGGLARKMPVTCYTMLVGVLAIVGTPLFSGWYSKDGIVAHALGFAIVHPEHGLLFILPVVTAALTAFYMFRMWYLTFVGTPRDPHLYEQVHEAPPLMTVPVIFLALGSVAVGWGWPLWDSESSALGAHLNQAQPPAVVADFGLALGVDPLWHGGPTKEEAVSERRWAQRVHSTGGLLALGAALLGFLFASVVYALRALDPSGTPKQFPATYQLLRHGYYCEGVYGPAIVAPAWTFAAWCQWFDTTVIDGLLHRLARLTLTIARWDGRFDRYLVDGLVNATARAVRGAGFALRRLQTGSLRNYVLFLVLGVLSLFAVVSYFVSRVAAG
jgi:NADH-quinone oxidoreductase subunit L